MILLIINTIPINKTLIINWSLTYTEVPVTLRKKVNNYHFAKVHVL